MKGPRSCTASAKGSICMRDISTICFGGKTTLMGIHKNDRSCISVLGVSMFPKIFPLDIGIVLTVRYFVVLFFIVMLLHIHRLLYKHILNPDV